ncbi:hypothetical protein ENUP19_0085G0087 [Entamoeba nuttalli]|uniref:Uncharacterized protein n=2 Tax=Entamoeba nuttalli TaxID=412467 RepID=K2HY16_ENTNP|nr:hypothetical protein ENU1_064620 [Entamoeba nuttalli P19]EKE41210.1 hypothetical protein ENU1_064620 [Entamoeba nuttalli P19]|eukprot:XP_008856455.1 hypothetical protein ENU1_064620 [Entamoeba nuttalli P19]
MKVSTHGNRTSFGTPLFQPNFNEQSNHYDFQSDVPRMSLLDDIARQKQSVLRTPQPRKSFSIKQNDFLNTFNSNSTFGALPQNINEEDSVILRDCSMKQTPEILEAIQPYGKVIGIEDAGEFGVKIKFVSRESARDLLLMRRIIIDGKPCETLDIPTFMNLQRISQASKTNLIFIQYQSFFAKFVEFLRGLWN